jgi:excisionase family DNA binding protein
LAAGAQKTTDQIDSAAGGGEPGPATAGKQKKTEYLTARQLAEVLQISEATIHRLRRTGRIPAVMLTERLIRFNLRDVQRALRPPHSSSEAGDQSPEDEGPSPQLRFGDFDSDFEG